MNGTVNGYVDSKFTFVITNVESEKTINRNKECNSQQINVQRKYVSKICNAHCEGGQAASSVH
jgi:hypothetical protein